MDQRDHLRELLATYHPYDLREQQAYDDIVAFVNEHEACFENGYLPGHITGAALVTDDTCEHVLLTHHTKLGRWLQFGGHSDGLPNVLETAMREAQEESGLTSLRVIPGREGIFDVDTHNIPAHGSIPEHTHYDIRILLAADRTEPYAVSHESNDLRWIALDDVSNHNDDPSMVRMVEKLRTL